MATDIGVILGDIGRDLARRGASAAIGELAESAIGSTPSGRVALSVVDALVEEYGDAAIEAIARRIHARQERRVKAMVDAAQGRNDRRRDEALERLERDQGRGHE